MFFYRYTLWLRSSRKRYFFSLIYILDIAEVNFSVIFLNSGFRIPDSGFRFPGFRVALRITNAPREWVGVKLRSFFWYRLCYLKNENNEVWNEARHKDGNCTLDLTCSHFIIELKVPMKWNFGPLFYSRKLKSMLYWFIIFKFGLRTSMHEFFLELQSWTIRVKMCDIPCTVKICKLVIRCVKPSSHHSIWGE